MRNQLLSVVLSYVVMLLNYGVSVRTDMVRDNIQRVKESNHEKFMNELKTWYILPEFYHHNSESYASNIPKRNLRGRKKRATEQRYNPATDIPNIWEEIDALMETRD